MKLKLVPKGEEKGKQFWSCSNYPICSYTREYVIPENRFDFANNDFMPIIKNLNKKSDLEKEEIVSEISAQMVHILEHFIECTWGAHYNTMFDELIKPYLTNSCILDFVLKGDSIKILKGNVIMGKTGAKVYPELFDYLMRVDSRSIKCYLENEFEDYLHKTYKNH